MRNLFLILLIVLLGLSCSDKNKMPKDILTRQKMEDVLWDIIRVEEFLNSYVMYKDTSVDRAAESKKWYDKVYQLHKITKKDFDRSYTYYKDHPALLKQILDSLGKKTAPTPPGQAIQTPRDTLKNRDTLSINSNKLRLLDTLSRKRILKKIPVPNG